MTSPYRGHSRGRLRGALIALALAPGFTLAALRPAAAAELIQNGGFEDLGGSLSGWAVGGTVDALTGADYGPCCASTGSEPAFSSNHFAAFGAGDVTGTQTLSQSVATVIGESYHLSFQAGTLGWPGDQAIFLGPLGSHTASVGADNPSELDLDTLFRSYSLDFTATQASTLLAFTVKTAGIDGHDAVLDNVSLTGPLASASAAVPEPAAWALMFAGFFGVGGALRASRGRRLAAAAL